MTEVWKPPYQRWRYEPRTIGDDLAELQKTARLLEAQLTNLLAENHEMRRRLTALEQRQNPMWYWATNHTAQAATTFTGTISSPTIWTKPMTWTAPDREGPDYGKTEPSAGVLQSLKDAAAMDSKPVPAVSTVSFPRDPNSPVSVTITSTPNEVYICGTTQGLEVEGFEIDGTTSDLGADPEKKD